MCRSPHPPKEEGFKRVVMCSGKVYYELAKKRAEEKKEKEVAIIRLEQVSSFSNSVCAHTSPVQRMALSRQPHPPPPPFSPSLYTCFGVDVTVSVVSRV